MDILFAHTWLNSKRDYKSGLEFYNKYGINEALKKLLSLGLTHFNASKLLSEIQSIAKANPEVFLPGIQKKKIDRAILPIELQTEFDKLQGLIQTISHHHSRLDLIQLDADRYNCAATILNAVEQRRFVFQRIDHFLQHGSDLIRNEPVKIKPVEILSENEELRKLQLKQQLILLRAQRTKLKIKPHRVADYNDVLDKIDKIEKQLN